MNFDALKAKWVAMPRRHKWIAGGAALCMLIAVSSGGHANAGSRDAAYGDGGYAATADDGDAGERMASAPQSGWNGWFGGETGSDTGPAMADAAPVGGGYGGTYGGGSADVPPMDSSAHDAQMAAWEDSQRSASQRSYAFGQLLNDTDTVRNNETGEVTTGVDQPVADAAVSSGDYSSVPTSELPTE